MKLPIDPSYPIANLSQILSRANLDLSPIELAEILWLAVQRGEIVVTEETPQQLSESIELPSSIDPPSNIQPEASEMPLQPQPEVNVDIVTEPPSSPSDAEIIEPAPTPIPVKIPEAVALRNRREIAKVLRPLMRKVPSRTRQAIDEEATAMRIAEDKIWNPVVKPEPERWLELAIVIEVTNIFDVWKDSIAEFQHLMERHGAFRDVRTWQVQTPENGEPQLFLQTATGLNRKPRNPKELLDAGGRRLVLFLSDCTSRAWRSGQIFQLLELWSRQNPVTIAQLLPERYWDRSALGSGYLVALRSQLPGARSRDWKVSGLSPRRRQRLQGGLKFPVVTIQPHSLGEWARSMAATGEQQTVGIVLKSDAFQIDRVADSGDESLTPKQLVQRFRGTASEKAQELADMMAVLPINWSVLRLLQKNLMQGIEDPAEGTGALYLAEIFLSGLLCPVEKKAQNLTATAQYDFAEGVRSVLLGGIPISEGREIGEELATAMFQQLPADVQQRVNADIVRRWGDSLSYFEAFLLPDLDWGEDAAAEMLPFAQVNGEVLRRWGGEYAVLAERLEQTRGNQSLQIIDQEQQEFYFELLRQQFDDLEEKIEIYFIERAYDFKFSLLREERDEFDIDTPDVVHSIELIKVNIVDILQLVDIGDQTARYEVEAEIFFSIEFDEFDYGDYVREIYGENNYQTITRLIPNRSVIVAAIVNAILPKGENSEIGIESINLTVDEPILVSYQDAVFTESNELEYEESDIEWQEIEFEVVTVEFGEDYPQIEAFDFDVATLTVSQLGLEIRRSPGQAYQFLELLSDRLILEMVQIPTGKFLMGAPKEEFCSESSEYLQHLVNVPEFYLGKYPITQEQWRFGASLPKIDRGLNSDPSYFKGKSLPVEKVSWLDAIEFCARLSRHTEREYRLPSEAEWEYACRARTTTPFHFGETIDPQLANYNGNYTYALGQKGEFRKKTTSVGSFQVANNYGLFDMHGNVWEWCQDYWHRSYQDAPNDGSEWIDLHPQYDRRSIRGGSWLYVPNCCRSASRYSYPPDYYQSNCGFRVACEIPRTL
jgi:formylglycine-generating enzyme required for sulfatase activity